MNVLGTPCALCFLQEPLLKLCVFVGAIMQIGDFGMSRGMEADHYESSGGVIPVKWSAPEVWASHILFSCCSLD